MVNRTSRYIGPLLIILLLLFWFNRDDIWIIFQTRPSAESLDFNKGKAFSESRTTIISNDEKINIDVFEKVHPAVVNIVATTLSMNFWMDVIPKEGQGSGFFIDKKGYILTNNHVVAKAQKITVTLADGRKMSASLIGRDPDSDLAVIKISPGASEVTAILGDSQRIRVGQKAIAIGNPFGLSHTLTTGIVSALNRSIRTDEGIQMDDLIQTDAAINPGNSGGPLLNSNGEVIGINTAIFSLSGGYQGIGFAIPIIRAKEIATQLITYRKVPRAWLGVTGISITEDLSKELGLGPDRGVLVVEVLPGSPANMAGLKGGNSEIIVGSLRLFLGGDIITAINGYPISNMKDLVHLLKKYKIGQAITLKVLRDLQSMEFQVKLAQKP